MTGKGIITNLYVCPKCSADMSGNNRPDRCPNCQYRFSNKDIGELTQKFEFSLSPYDQLYELVQQDMEKIVDEPTSKVFPNMPKDKADAITLSNKSKLQLMQQKRREEMIEFFRTAPLSDITPWLQSLVHFYQVLMRRSDVKEVKTIADYGVQIGEISKHIKELINLGAQFHDGSNKKSSGGDS